MYDPSMPRVDGVRTERHLTDLVWWECTECFDGDGLVFVETVPVARQRAHRHTAKTGHRTQVMVHKRFVYVKAEVRPKGIYRSPLGD